MKKNVCLAASIALNVLLVGILAWGWNWTGDTLFQNAAATNRADAAYKSELLQALNEQDAEELERIKTRLQIEVESAKSNAAAFASAAR